MSQEDRSATPLDPETLSRLAGGLAHELKNPLSTIGLHLALLEEEWGGDEEDPRVRRTKRTLATLRTEVERLNSILEDFLRFARTDQLERAPVDLNELVERVVRFVQPEAERQGVHLATYLDLDLPPVPLDGRRISQALLNLIINARQALTPGGGGHITLITRRDADGVVLEVVDDGPGMTPEVLERCFEVYYSTKKEGSGLGLPTVRRLAEAHGGHLDMQSSPGNGTRVALHLPLAEEEDVRA